MAQPAGIATINVCTIQVGTTGTIGSLMTWELESMKHVKPPPPPLEPLTPTTPRLKHQSPPVSVPCGATPKRTALPRRSPANEAASSSSSHRHGRPTSGGIVINSRRSSSSSSGDVAAIQNILTDDVPKTARQTPRKNGSGGGRISTVLSPGSRMERDGAAKIKERAEKNKGQRRHSFLVEVVDLKCNNPMSSRLKKLGFSKLSETIA